MIEIEPGISILDWVINGYGGKVYILNEVKRLKQMGFTSNQIVDYLTFEMALFQRVPCIFNQRKKSW
jgi:hypothetical protein